MLLTTCKSVATDDVSLPQNAGTPSLELSKLEGFRGFVESMVESIILDDKAFDDFKEELKTRCEDEGVDYDNLEVDLEDFLELLDSGIKSPDGLAVAMGMGLALMDAEKNYVRPEKIEEISRVWIERHPKHEFHPHNPINGFSK